MAKRRNVDYNALRKRVAPFYSFKFRQRKNVNYTPQQKGVIVRTYNRLIDYIKRVDKGQASFLKIKPSLKKHIDGLSTNKGIFYKYPNARLKRLAYRVKNRKRFLLVIEWRFKDLLEWFIPFPKNLNEDFQQVILFVEYWQTRLDPDYITWSFRNRRGGTPYNPEAFYGSSGGAFVVELKDDKQRPTINGVFFGWFPDSKKRQKK